MCVVSCEQKLKTMLEYVYRTALFNYLKIIRGERKLKIITECAYCTTFFHYLGIVGLFIITSGGNSSMSCLLLVFYKRNSKVTKATSKYRFVRSLLS